MVKKILLSAFFVISALASALPADQKSPRGDYRNFPPLLESAENTADYVLYLRSILREAFRNDKTWYVDPVLVITREQKFLRWLNQPEVKQAYERELPYRNPMKKIQVQIETAQLIAANTVSDEGIHFLRAHFTDFERDKSLNSEGIHHELQGLINSLKGQSSAGFTTGLIQSLPAELKAAAFKLPAEEKLNFLLKNLTDEQLRTNFRTNVYKPEELSVSMMASEIDRITATEEKIALLALYRDWQGHGATEAAFNELADIKPVAGEAQGPQIQKLASAKLRNFIQQTKTPEWSTKEKISIREISPNLGLFRGCLNGDCFTSYAYGFAYSPAEKTFLVSDEEGQLMTSVYATEVRVGRKKTLYVHEMGSASVSPLYGPVIMRALYAAKEQLGYSQIVFGEKGMHHGAFKTEIMNSAQETERVALTYIDPIFRNLIGDELVRETDSTYSKAHDIPSAHPFGRVYIPTQVEDYRIVTNTVSYKEPKFAEQVVSLEEKTSFILETLSRGQDQLAQAVYLSIDKDLTKLSELKAAINNIAVNNTQSKPIHEFYENIKTQMIKAHLSWNDFTIKRYQADFATGHLNAPDAWQGPDSPVTKTTVELFSAKAKNNPSDPLLGRYYITHPEIFTTVSMEKVFRSFLKDNRNSLGKAVVLGKYYQKAQVSSATLDALYSALNFQDVYQISQVILQVLRSTHHTPSPQQLNLVLSALEGSQYSRTVVLNVLEAKPEIVNAQLLQKLRGYQMLQPIRNGLQPDHTIVPQVTRIVDLATAHHAARNNAPLCRGALL